MKKLFLVIYNRISKRRYFKYFETEHEMDKYRRKLKYSKNLILIEDSRDVYFGGID